jgi:hypothetical protein
MALSDTREAVRRRWPSVRALLLALVIVVALIDGAPIPTPRVIAHLPPLLQKLSLGLYDVQAFLLAPFRPIKETFGINQRWALFSSTGPLRHRMWVEGRRGDEPWTLLFRALDDQHDYASETLEYRRVRNVWNPNRRGAKPLYPAFAAWMARRIFLEHPELDQARIRMERVTILEHGQGFQSTGEFDDVIEHRREEVLR